MVRLAVAGGGLALGAFVVGCPQSPDWPPFVRSGPSGGNIVGGAGSAVDGGVETEVDGGDGGGTDMFVACVYLPGGMTIQQCVIQPSIDLASTEASCTGTDSNELDGKFIVGNCPTSVAGTGGAGDPLVGCCTGAGLSYQNPAYTCYYTGVAATLESTCTGALVMGTWTSGLPALP